MGDKYKLKGSRTPGEKTDQIILKGTSTNPEEVLELNGPAVELTKTQFNDLDEKYVLEKDSESEPSSGSSGSESSSSSSSEKSNN